LAEINSNAKVRSLDNIDARSKTAHILKAHDLFSYAKWELHPSHPLVQEMEHAFSTEIKDTVEQFLRSQSSLMSNLLRISRIYLLHSIPLETSYRVTMISKVGHGPLWYPSWMVRPRAMTPTITTIERRRRGTEPQQFGMPRNLVVATL
jgi:hypothetical protein